MAITAARSRPGVHLWPMDAVPDPEVPERPTRRRYGAAYKVAILAELDQATAPGAKGAILRREGLYSSQITDWRRLRAPRRSRGAGPIARTQAFSATSGWGLGQSSVPMATCGRRSVVMYCRDVSEEGLETDSALARATEEVG